MLHQLQDIIAECDEDSLQTSTQTEELSYLGDASEDEEAYVECLELLSEKFENEELTHQHCADIVVFEIERNAFGAVFELNEFTGHHLLKAVDTSNAVAHLQDGTHIADRNRLVVVLNLLFEDGADLVGTDGNHGGYTLEKGVRGGAWG